MNPQLRTTVLSNVYQQPESAVILELSRIVTSTKEDEKRLLFSASTHNG